MKKAQSLVLWIGFLLAAISPTAGADIRIKSVDLDVLRKEAVSALTNAGLVMTDTQVANAEIVFQEYFNSLDDPKDSTKRIPEDHSRFLFMPDQGTNRLKTAFALNIDGTTAVVIVDVGTKKYILMPSCEVFGGPLATATDADILTFEKSLKSQFPTLNVSYDHTLTVLSKDPIDAAKVSEASKLMLQSHLFKFTEFNSLFYMADNQPYIGNVRNISTAHGSVEVSSLRDSGIVVP